MDELASQLISLRVEEQDRHDEAMRMQALAIGARLAIADPAWAQLDASPVTDRVWTWAKWVYRQATAREW